MFTGLRSRKGRLSASRPSMQMRAEALESRLTPANFYVPPGDTAAFIAAINSCNVNNQPDTIDLATGSTYVFTAAADGADGGNALPSILRDSADANTITIHGNGATLQRSTDTGTPQFRFFRIGVFPDNVSADISNLTFANGDAGGGKGGAILQQSGNLSLTGCTFQGNQADTGGAVYLTTTSTTPLSVSVGGSTFTGNTATGSNNGGAGGAVYVFGASNLSVDTSTFAGNTSLHEGSAIREQSSSASVSISGSSFTGNTAGGAGAIVDQGPTNLTNVIVTNNTSGGSGGGVWIQTSTKTSSISGSVISNNSTTGASGGGLFVQSPVTIANTAIQNNTCGNTGGGVFFQNSGGATITGVTIAGNQATGSTGAGGGLYCQGPLTMTDSTIDGNRAGNGGGLAFVNGSLTGTITNSTITDNRAFFALATGGGIQVNVNGAGTLSLGHTIVAGNGFEATVSNGTGPDVGGPIASLGYNLIQNTQGTTINGSQSGNLTGVSPNLAPLADNGGPTQTRLPNAGSPVIDAGDPNFYPPPATDQRGLPRVVNGRIDIGAVEVDTPPRVIGIAVNDGSAQRSEVRSIAVTFTDPVTFAGGNANAAAAFQLKHVQTGNVVALSASVSTDSRGRTVVTLGFSGGETDPVSVLHGGTPSLADGRYQLTISASAVAGPGGVALDGNGDGAAGGDYVSPADSFGGTGPHLYRIFGDANGDGVVDTIDLGQFRSTFNANSSQANYLTFLDADNSGAVDVSDLSQFRSRFNANVF